MGEILRPCPTWMLDGLMMAVLGLFAAGKTMSTPAEKLNVLTAQRGDTVNIYCVQTSNKSEGISVTLKRKTNLCSKTYNNRRWMGECNQRFGVLWNNETKTIFAIMQEVQINDSDIYTCEVEKLLPFPRKIINTSKTSLIVAARPTVFVSHVEGSRGPPQLLCSSQGFYPDGLEQVWLCDGQLLNSTSTHSVNTDGTFTLNTALSLSSAHAKDGVCTCWVNHSTLSEPINVNHTLSLSGEQRGALKEIHIIAVVCGAVFAVSVVGLIIVFGANIRKKTESRGESVVYANTAYDHLSFRSPPQQIQGNAITHDEKNVYEN